MGIFERYIEEFTNTVSLEDFLVNLIVAAVLCVLLRFFYIRFANAVNNRQRFANNFLALGLTTMLVITIVKSSIALSLGLVGALSIVRFRAAIKDPEELTYLFLAIAIGLATGANQPLIAIIASAIILLLLFLFKQLVQTRGSSPHNAMYFFVHTDVDDLPRLTEILTRHFSFVELKRLDKSEAGLDVSFTIKTESVAAIEAVKSELSQLSPSTTLSLVDQPDLVV